jgi:hypothetical protein
MGEIWPITAESSKLSPPEVLQRVAAIIRKGLSKPGKRPHNACSITHQQIKRSQEIAFPRAIIDEPIARLFSL